MTAPQNELAPAGNSMPWQPLTAASLAPAENLPPFVLRAGMTPCWVRWRGGNFMEHPTVFDSLWKAFGQWRAEQVENTAKPSKHLRLA